MADLLTLDKVVAGHGALQVLTGIDLSLRAGETLAVLGRNGVGKTTLVETIMGLTRQTAGRILWRGADITPLPAHKRGLSGIALVPQAREVFGALTVEENLIVAARGDHWTLSRIYDLFPRLKERRRNGGKQLSGGEQQMLAIGRALSTNPALLLLDEPFEGLAPVIVDQIIDALAQIRAEGDLAVVLVEHQVDLALPMADRALILDRGTVTYTGTADALLGETALLASLIGLGAA